MLQLVLKKKWFDMIESGEKLEEYREIKPYWFKRILTSQFIDRSLLPHGWYNSKHKQVRFRLGYAKNAPEMTFKIEGVKIGNAKPEWAEGQMGEMIIVKLGNRIK